MKEPMRFVKMPAKEERNPSGMPDDSQHQREQEAEKNRKRISWVILVLLALLCLTGFVLRRMQQQKSLAGEPMASPLDLIFSTQHDSDYRLIQSIDRTVRQYYSASTIDEKIPFVRHAEQMRPRMEIHYARHPLQVEQCERVSNYKPISLGARTFWKVLALKNGGKGEMLMLEQISDTEVRVDWDSQVDYEAIPWSEYCLKPVDHAISYRLHVEETHRYVAEFMNESQWVSYALTKPGTEGPLYGYVKRNSPEHTSMQAGIAANTRRMILNIQASPGIKAKDSVVIHKVISETPYRIDPPGSAND
ncbi:MAG: hypothetical protein RI957_1911 [Verrucomicrobiota bacterium]